MVKRLLYRKVPRKTSTSFSHRSASCPQRTWSIGKINWEPYRLSSTHRMRVDSSEKGFFAKCFNLGMLSIRVYYTVILLCEGISKKKIILEETKLYSRWGEWITRFWSTQGISVPGFFPLHAWSRLVSVSKANCSCFLFMILACSR